MTHRYATRNPQSEARRQHVHGRLVTDDARPRFDWLEFGTVALLCVVVTLLIVAFS